MPLQYKLGIMKEHLHCRSAAGLFDVSHMLGIKIHGAERAKFAERIMPANVQDLAEGHSALTFLPNDDGGIIDDLITYRRCEQKFLVVPNAGNAKVVAAALAERVSGKEGGFDVTVQDASAETSLIAVQGPKAQEILLRLVPAAQHELVTELKYYAAVDVPFMFGGASQDLLLARTGYTGEDGFEIFVDNDAAAALWQALIAIAEDGELTPAGLASRDSLRLEAGMPLYGNELSLEGDPFAAGLGPVVALSKEGDFIGKAALAAKKEAGAGSTAGRKLVGLKGLGRRAGRGHYPVLKDGNVVGEVTSGQPSPTLGYPVAMAYVDVEFTEPGTALDIDLRGKTEPFEVVALPFYKRQK